MNFSTTLSGLINASDRMNEAARDISRATLPVNTTPADPTPGPVAAPADTQAATGPAARPDLAGAMVRQIEASLSFMASVQTLKREDETVESLLSIR